MNHPVTLFMCGDVMTGRGIDQMLPNPGEPTLYEPYMKSARGYVTLAEEINGPFQQPIDFPYVWGDALDELKRVAPDLRIINLATTITKSNDYWKDKDIHYRMCPENIPCITAARIDFCSLANNHILDWGYAGLRETLDALNKVNIRSAGANRNIGEAETPAVIEIKEKGRVVVFSFGSETSGIPLSWAASKNKPGINLLRDFSDQTVSLIKEKVQEVKRERDIVVVSIHWGDNWGYEVSDKQREFAHNLIDNGGIDLIHGHSYEGFLAALPTAKIKKKK